VTENIGKELLMSYLEDFHAKTLVQPEKELESQEQEVPCGDIWHGLLGKYDLNTHSWKTVQCSLLEDLEEFSETFPRWGWVQNGALYPLPTLVQTISVKEFGLEPNNETFFHMPNTTGMDGGSNSRKALKKRLKWPTPQARDHKGSSGRSNTGQELDLPTKVKLWPTPTANMHKGSGPTLIRNDGKDRSWDSLHYAVEQVTDIGGTLNPTWVEWLMNWPINWSNLNVIDSKEYQRWKETSTKTFQKSDQLREMWWDNDPSQASFGQQPNEQSEQQHCYAVPQMPRDTSRQREMEGSYEGTDLPLLCNDIYLFESQTENVQSGMWEQISVDETKIVPRTDKNIVARVDRLKAIGNGQVPLCAATAWELLK